MSDQTNEKASIQKLLEATARIEERQRISSLDSLYLLILPLTVSLAGTTITIATRLLPTITPFYWFSLLLVVGMALIPVLYYCRGIYSEDIEMRLKAFDHTIRVIAILMIATIIQWVLSFLQEVFKIDIFSRVALLAGFLAGGGPLAYTLSAHLTERYIAGAFLRRMLFPSRLEKLVQRYRDKKKHSHLLFIVGLSSILAGLVSLITEDYFLSFLILLVGGIGFILLMIAICERILKYHL